MFMNVKVYSSSSCPIDFFHGDFRVHEKTVLKKC